VRPARLLLLQRKMQGMPRPEQVPLVAPGRKGIVVARAREGEILLRSTVI
jgi:hypothetical protein